MREGDVIVFAGIRDLAADHSEIKKPLVELFSDLLSISACYMVIQSRIRGLESADLSCEIPDLIT